MVYVYLNKFCVKDLFLFSRARALSLSLFYIVAS
jgi:hypothetical protein